MLFLSSLQHHDRDNCHGCAYDRDYDTSIPQLSAVSEIIRRQQYIQHDSEHKKRNPRKSCFIGEKHHHERTQDQDCQHDRDDDI